MPRSSGVAAGFASAPESADATAIQAAKKTIMRVGGSDLTRRLMGTSEVRLIAESSESTPLNLSQLFLKRVAISGGLRHV